MYEVKKTEEILDVAQIKQIFEGNNYS